MKKNHTRLRRLKALKLNDDYNINDDDIDDYDKQIDRQINCSVQY